MLHQRATSWSDGAAPPFPAIAVGGYSSMPVYCTPKELWCGLYCYYAPFDLPYQVADGDEPIRYDGHYDHVIRLFAASAGQATLEVVSPGGDELYGTVTARAETLAAIDVSYELDLVDDLIVGDSRAVVASNERGGDMTVKLVGTDGTLLVDSAIAIRVGTDLEVHGEGWYDGYHARLDSVPAGLHVVDVEAGTLRRTDELEIVNSADAIEVRDLPAAIPYNPWDPAGPSARACFTAIQAGRVVAGLKWTYHLDDRIVSSTTSCVTGLRSIYPPPHVTRLDAYAGGSWVSVQIPAVWP
jgi:hypothetical protein